MVCLQYKNCMIHAYLSASEVIEILTMGAWGANSLIM